MTISGIISGLAAAVAASGMPSTQIHSSPRLFRDLSSLLSLARIPAAADPLRPVRWAVLDCGPASEAPWTCTGVLLRTWPLTVEIWREAATQAADQQGTSDSVLLALRDDQQSLMNRLHNDIRLSGQCAWIDPASIAASVPDLVDLSSDAPEASAPVLCWHCTVSCSAIERIVVVPI